MKIRQFIIQNYRAIEKIDLNLNYSINPIIGVNESGKTSVLQAILAFDKNRDKSNNGDHLLFQNRYSLKDTKDCQISALLRLDKDEIEKLIQCTKVKTNSEDYSKLLSIGSKTEFKLTRHLSEDGKYTIQDSDYPDQLKDKIAKFLVSNLPFILYFDDFTDRVPEEIIFPSDYTLTGKLPKSKIRDWQEIIEEIFRRADIEGIEKGKPLQAYIDIHDRQRKKGVLLDIQDMLNEEIIKEWKKIKKSGKTNFADDSDELELEIDNPEPCKFLFQVKDKSNKGKGRLFNVAERSKGFQWFFNYMIKLKFNPNYKASLEDCLFLLDEPGSYLHSSAQSELLKELKSVSKKNYIIFCTHSQYLLNPDIIRLGSIKIVEKEKSIVLLSEYGNYKTKRDKGALSPVYQALHLNFAHDFLGNIVITEGITDYYLINLIKKYQKYFKTEFTIIPSCGAGDSSVLISLALPYADDFIVLFDNDTAGESAIKKYKKEFGDEIEKKFFVYGQQLSKFVFEDFLSPKDKQKLKTLSQTEDLKKAIAILYIDLLDEQEKFIKSLEKVTLTNFKLLFEKINLFQ